MRRLTSEIPTTELPGHEEILAMGSMHPEQMGEIREIQDPDLIQTLDILRAEYPDLLKKILLDIGDPRVDTALQGQPAIFGPEETMGYQPRISLATEMIDEAKWFDKIQKERPISISIVEEKMKLVLREKFQGLNSKILKIYILLHEFGHAEEYFIKYKTSHLVSNKKAAMRRSHNMRELWDDLPIPGAPVGVLRKAWRESQGQNEDEKVASMIAWLEENFFKKHRPGDHFDRGKFIEERKGYRSIEKMLDDNELNEKYSEVEEMADDFAIVFLQEHWDELGLNKQEHE